MHAFLYYLNNISENPQLREKVELGLKYLSNPLKARMSGVASEPEESYGAFAVQATGFAGLSLAEGITKNARFPFDLFRFKFRVLRKTRQKPHKLACGMNALFFVNSSRRVQ